MAKQPAQTNLIDDLLNTLHFEDSGKRLDALKQALFKTPETNDAKIEFIKAELKSGRYEINADRIAEKLIEQYEKTESPETA